MLPFVRREVEAGVVEVDFYIDIAFIVNFIADYLLLATLRFLLKLPGSRQRIAGGSAAGAVYGCLLPFCADFSMILSVTMSGIAAALMVRIAYGPVSKREWIKEVLALYVLAVGFGGIMELLYEHTKVGSYMTMVWMGQWEYALPTVMWLAMAAGSILLMRAIWQFWQELSRERKYLYPVWLFYGKTRVKATGYLDTGNRLVEPVSGEAVQIVSSDVWQQLGGGSQNSVLIPYRTVGNPGGMMEGIRIDRMEIRQIGFRERKIVKRNLWIAKAPFEMSGNGMYDILINSEL